MKTISNLFPRRRPGLFFWGSTTAILAALSLPTLSFAQESGDEGSSANDLMVVFDGSGSMWGDLDGRTKIETAREVLASVLDQPQSGQNLGMIAYGHREKGNCADIETLVGLGPAMQTTPQMISAAKALNPKGKTPLSDAVSRAASELRFTENAATVVLITDGLETCDADPCALGKQLEADGLDFTAHVIGFGLGAAESEQLACLARETGGQFLSAETADQLETALSQTVSAPVDTEKRNVEFIFRDSPDTALLGIRQLKVALSKADGETLGDDVVTLLYTEVNEVSARAILDPGDYIATIDRSGAAPYTVTYRFTVPEGDGTHLIEADLVGRLVLRPYVNPTLVYDPKNAPVSALKGRAYAVFDIFPVSDGQVAADPVVSQATDRFDFPLVPGRYLVRGNLNRMVSIEQVVDVSPDGPTEVDASFDATPVTIVAQDETGAPVSRQSTFFYAGEPKGRTYFRRGGGGEKPHFLPAGRIGINVGQEGGGDSRSWFTFEPDGTFEPVTLNVDPRRRPDADILAAHVASPDCVEILKVKYTGCLVTPMTKDGRLLDDMPTPDDVRIEIDETMTGEMRLFQTFEEPTLSAEVVIDANAKVALLSLPNNWCRDRHACPAIEIDLPSEAIDMLEGEDYRTKTIKNDQVELAIESFGQTKSLYVSEIGSGGRPATVFELK